MTSDERLIHAERVFEAYVFNGDAGDLMSAELGLDGVEADLALSRGRLEHMRFLAGLCEQPNQLPWLERAAALYENLGDIRAQAESLFWIGMYHQVVQHDDAMAAPVLRHAYDLATDANDDLTASYVLRNLGLANLRQGSLQVAREQLEEAVRLARGAGFLPGLAANLIGLAYVAAAQGSGDDFILALCEADMVATRSGATNMLHSITQLRESVTD